MTAQRVGLSKREVFRELTPPLIAWLATVAIGATFFWGEIQRFGTSSKESSSLMWTFVRFAAMIVAGGLTAALMKRAEVRLQIEKVSEAEERIQAAPEKAKPAWDLARIKLEFYFNRNLSQISWIFWLSVLVMLAGLGVTVWGVKESLSIAEKITANPELAKSAGDTLKSLPAIMAAVAGVITQFIGATFLFVYRSTIQQAASYSKTLERINSVGMAMQILDTMPDETKEGDLKSQTKAKLIEMLVKGAHEERGVPEKQREETAVSKAS